MKEIKVTVTKIETSIQDEALKVAGLSWKNDIQFFKIDGNNVSIFIEEPENPVVCEFCGAHTTEKNLTFHILRFHPEEQ